MRGHASPNFANAVPYAWRVATLNYYSQKCLGKTCSNFEINKGLINTHGQATVRCTGLHLNQLSIIKFYVVTRFALTHISIYCSHYPSSPDELKFAHMNSLKVCVLQKENKKNLIAKRVCWWCHFNMTNWELNIWSIVYWRLYLKCPSDIRFVHKELFDCLNGTFRHWFPMPVIL